MLNTPRVKKQQQLSLIGLCVHNNKLRTGNHQDARVQRYFAFHGCCIVLYTSHDYCIYILREMLSDVYSVPYGPKVWITTDFSTLLQ